MIYTVTCNPAIDHLIFMDQLQQGEINRPQEEEYHFGGKGINVSAVLKELGAESVATGFVSGWTGKALREGLEASGLRTDFVELDPAQGNTRVNVKIREIGKSDSGETGDGKHLDETALNGPGPKATDEDLDRLLEKVAALKDGDILVLSGSVPSGMPDDTYEKIIARAGVPTVVDATGKLLLRTLAYHPLLIKPNDSELAEMLGTAMQTEAQIIEGARRLRAMGARNVLVSRGAEGAVLVTETDEVISSAAIPGQAVNTMGAGDSMVAGFLAGYLEKKDYQYALRLGTAAGAATACTAGLAVKEDILCRLAQLESLQI